MGTEPRTVRLPAPPARSAPRSRAAAALLVAEEFDSAPDTEVDPDPGALTPEEYELQSTRVEGSVFQEAPTRRSHMMTEALAAREVSMARARRLPVRDARMAGLEPAAERPDADFFEEKTTRVRPTAPRPAPSRAVVARPVPPPLPPSSPRPQRLALKPPPFQPPSLRPPPPPMARTAELPPLEPPWPVLRSPRRERRRRPSGVLVIVSVVAATFGIELCRVLIEAALRRPRPATVATPPPKPATVIPLPPVAKPRVGDPGPR